jgi:predicted Zn finger-like uncharacterized protein
MLIVCPSCATSYDVEPANLQSDGRFVRCIRCRTVWRARPPLLAADTASSAAATLPARPTPFEGEVPIAATDGGVGPAAALVDEAADADRFDQAPQEHSGEPIADPLAEKAPRPASMPDAGGSGSAPVEVEAPPIAPTDPNVADPAVGIDTNHGVIEASAQNSNVERLAARRSRQQVSRRRQRWSLSRWHTAIVVLVILDSIILGWRTDIVRLLPQTASLYSAIGLGVNLQGLSFAGLKTSSGVEKGVPVLVVQGNIVNDHATAIDVPRLKFVVRNAARQEIYSWSTAPPLPRLLPHHAVGFRTRLASPPPGASDVLVRFLNRRDSIADTR